MSMRAALSFRCEVSIWSLALLLLAWRVPIHAVPPLPFALDLPGASATAQAVMKLDRPVERDVLVPDGFEAWRTPKEMVVKYFNKPLKSIKLKVGAGRTIVTTSKIYIYPVGGSRPKDVPSSLDGYPPAGSMGRLGATDGGDLVPGKLYIVEMEIFIIEIHENYREGDKSVPGGGKDKVIWTKTVRQIPKEEPRLPEKILRELMGSSFGEPTSGLPPGLAPGNPK